jgi:hypothetical protein
MIKSYKCETFQCPQTSAISICTNFKNQSGFEVVKKCTRCANIWEPIDNIGNGVNFRMLYKSGVITYLTEFYY